jgi:PAS domain S-box-containing protein
VNAPAKPPAREVETRFEEMKRYVRFSSEDAARVAASRPGVEKHFERIAQEFYDRTREHEDAHAVFTGEDQIERLQASLAEWMRRLFSGKYDEDYFAQSLRIGSAHVRVGLPQRYMFTGMAILRSELGRLVGVHLGAEAVPTRESLDRLLDLELGIMLEGYREHMAQRIQAKTEHEASSLLRTLARTEHRHAAAVELARVFMAGLDRQGAVRLFNREAERVTGYDRDEVLGEAFVDTLLADEAVREDGARIRAAYGGQSIREPVFESTIKTRAGKLRDMRWQLAYSDAEGDDEVVLFVIGQDVTAENVARERARQQEKLAAIGTLAAGLAHEIRNPLNGAQLHVAFLERALKRSEGTTPDMLDAVTVVGDEIKRLALLVSEFLDFARPRPLTVRELVAQALCERACGLVAAQAEKAGVQVELDVPPADLTFNADASRLEQVLLNLLNNAIEALAPNGGGRVVVRARRQPRHVTFEVEDDGPGIARPDAPIFDAFFSTKPEGTGLGLAIVHRIVTDHGGNVDVESRPGKTRFKVRVPLGREAEA